MIHPELFTDIEEAVFKDAHITRCGKFRYWLVRKWNPGENYICWIMLNPSTTDASKDDPTIKRCITFSKKWGFDGLYVVNLYAYRATDPKELKKAGFPKGEFNDFFVKFIASICKKVVCAWGNHGQYKNRYYEILKLLLPHSVKVYSLGYTKTKQPKHPLYVCGDTELIQGKGKS